MREDAYRAFLAPRLGARSVDSYVSDLRAVERFLSIDLDETALDSDAIETLRLRLNAAGMPGARASNCSSALKHYAVFRERRARPEAVPSTILAPRPTFITEARVAELMRLYADILAELRSRGVTRTANSPVGDYAELLFARAFEWTLTGNSAAHYDATDASGIRYQIKSRRIGNGSGGRQLGALRNLPEAGFDMLAAVLFDRDLGVLRAALIPFATVAARAKRVEHMNAWRFMLNDAVWDVPGVRDATAALRITALTI